MFTDVAPQWKPLIKLNPKLHLYFLLSIKQPLQKLPTNHILYCSFLQQPSYSYRKPRYSSTHLDPLSVCPISHGKTVSHHIALMAIMDNHNPPNANLAGNSFAV